MKEKIVKIKHTVDDFLKCNTDKSASCMFFVCFIAGILFVGYGVMLLNYYVVNSDGTSADESMKMIKIMFGCFSAVLSFIGVALVVFSIKYLRKRKEKYELNSFFAAIVLSVNSLLLPEIVMNSYFFKSSLLYVLLGFLLCFALYLFGIVFFVHPQIWLIIVSAFFTFYSVMQYYIVLFRAAPIQFADLKNIKSGLEVKSEYKITVQIMTIYALVNFAATVFVVVKNKYRKPKLRTRAISAAGLVVSVAVIFFVGRFSYNMGVNSRYIRMNFSAGENQDTYSQVGYSLMFCFDGMFNHVAMPDGYSDEKAETILSQYKTEKATKKPTVIAILNESFADFQHIASFKTSEDYLENYHKLASESVTGYTTVSAYGGYTCNSEYEFLTGNTMNFLPAGSAPYMEYLNGKQDSLVSYLNSIGYFTVAISPCSADLWNIGTAYKNLQFHGTTLSCEDQMSNVTKVNDEISDISLFKYVEKRYEEKGDESAFFWVTTMQNHGGYSENVDKTYNSVTFKDYNNIPAQNYLNYIKQSDKALKELTDYFRSVKEEVVIVMFGDHYPHLPEFSSYLYGQNISTLSTENYSRLHQTPFIIWDNKSTSSADNAKKIDNISLNYLANEVMKTAKIPLAPYQQELEKVREKIPIISGFGYMTDKKDWYTVNSTANGYEDVLNEYKIMQYYRMFGKKS